MKFIRSSILTLTCVFMFCADANSEVVSDHEKAKKVFEKFYKAMGKPYNIGIPDVSLQKKLRPYVSAELNKTIKEAAMLETECMTVYGKHNKQIMMATPKGQAPEILKPPMVEGSIFVSQYESPDSFKILSADTKNSKIMLVIQYTAYDGSNSANYTWKNKVELIHENGVWKIDDFIDVEDPSNKPADEKTHVKYFLKNFPSCKNEFRS
jgi:hypothetical protein